MQFTEKIHNMQAVRDDRLGLVVSEMTYVLICEDGQQQDVCMRRIVLDHPAENGFVPFDNLSESDALAWASQKLGAQEIDSMKHGMQSKMESRSGSMQFSVNAPWMNT